MEKMETRTGCLKETELDLESETCLVLMIGTYLDYLMVQLMVAEKVFLKNDNLGLKKAWKNGTESVQDF